MFFTPKFKVSVQCPFAISWKRVLWTKLNLSSQLYNVIINGENFVIDCST